MSDDGVLAVKEACSRMSDDGVLAVLAVKEACRNLISAKDSADRRKVAYELKYALQNGFSWSIERRGMFMNFWGDTKCFMETAVAFLEVNQAEKPPLEAYNTLKDMLNNEENQIGHCREMFNSALRRARKQCQVRGNFGIAYDSYSKVVTLGHYLGLKDNLPTFSFVLQGGDYIRSE